jgi:hypothetical protein
VNEKENQEKYYISTYCGTMKIIIFIKRYSIHHDANGKKNVE